MLFCLTVYPQKNPEKEIYHSLQKNIKKHNRFQHLW